APSRARASPPRTSPRGGVLAAKVSEEGKVERDKRGKDARQQHICGVARGVFQAGDWAGTRHGNRGGDDGGRNQRAVVEGEFEQVAGVGADRKYAAQPVSRRRSALIGPDRASESHKQN